MDDSARMQILQAVEDGQISAKEAARLLDAIAGKTEGGDPPIRFRVVETESARTRVDLVLPLGWLEMMAQLGLHPAALWGMNGDVDAASVVAAARSGRKGILAEAVDEAHGTRVELIVDDR